MFNASILGKYGDSVPRDSDGNIPEFGDEPNQFVYPVLDYAGEEVENTHSGRGFSELWLKNGFKEWVNEAKYAMQKVVAKLNMGTDPYDVAILEDLFNSIATSSFRRFGGKQMSSLGEGKTPEDIAGLISEDIRYNNGLI